METPTKAEWNLPVHKDWNQHKNHTSKNPPSVNKSKVLANLSQISWKNNVGMAMKSHLLFLQRQVGHAFFFIISGEFYRKKNLCPFNTHFWRVFPDECSGLPFCIVLPCKTYTTLRIRTTSKRPEPKKTMKKRCRQTPARYEIWRYCWRWWEFATNIPQRNDAS